MKELKINIGKIEINANLFIPEKAKSLVIFAHGSGSSRFSTRNNFVANILQQQGIGTLLLDLLTENEEKIDIITRKYRFNIPLMSERLIEVTKWIKENEETKKLNIGYFGSSTGAAAALIGAAKLQDLVMCVVSRGGRPDLALDFLHEVKAPTLLIVGEEDESVIEINTNVLKDLNCEKEIKIVLGATHLFEEPGKLEEVSALAGEWFKKYL